MYLFFCSVKHKSKYRNITALLKEPFLKHRFFPLNRDLKKLCIHHIKNYSKSRKKSSDKYFAPDIPREQTRTNKKVNYERIKKYASFISFNGYQMKNSRIMQLKIRIFICNKQKLICRQKLYSKKMNIMVHNKFKRYLMLIWDIYNWLLWLSV